MGQNLTAESYAHFDAHGCDGGCGCTWLSEDKCDDQSWCCAWACRNNYGNPQNCADPDGSEYGQIEWGDCDGAAIALGSLKTIARTQTGAAPGLAATTTTTRKVATGPPCLRTSRG